MYETDILIVGSGPTGLTLAAFLAHYGADFFIIDQAPKASVHSKAVGIQARTLEELQLIGVSNTLVARGFPVSGVNVYSEYEQIAQVYLSEIPSKFNYILMLPQPETEQVLLEYLASHNRKVERSQTLQSFEQDASGVTAFVMSDLGVESSIRCKWLVGCDGAHSTVRHQLNLSFEGNTLPQKYLLGDIEFTSKLRKDHLHIFTQSDGMLALFPLGRNRYRIIADNPTDRIAGDDMTILDWHNLVQERASVPCEISNLTWTAQFQVNNRIVDTMRRNRVFVAGDSAAVHSPAAAQGMNSGIQDAINLAWKLAAAVRHSASDEILQSYTLERLPVEKSVVHNSDLLLQAAGVKGVVATTIRDFLAPLATHFQPIQHKMQEGISELSVNYRTSTLTSGSAAATGVAPGDRLPDAALIASVDDAPQTLYQLLSAATHGAPRHLLIIWAGSSYSAHDEEWITAARELMHASPLESRTVVVTPEPRLTDHSIPRPSRKGAYIDNNQEFGKNMGPNPLFVVVRPDAYIAYIGKSADLERLSNFLSHYLMLLNGDESQPAAVGEPTLAEP